jgi:two-component system sensor histidine kinase TctE
MGRTSLRWQLLRWLLAPLLLALLITSWFSNRAAVATADKAFDRLLTASAEAIAEDVEFKDGTVVVDLPYAALELLESNIQERIFYRVVSPDGSTATGYDDLPLPGSADTAQDGKAEAMLYTADYRGDTVHLVALNKKLYGTGSAAPVIVIVAETGESRDALSRQILIQGLTRQALLIVAAGLLVWFGLYRGLRPLNRLRRSVAERAANDLSPIDSADVQTEVRPLIEALNQHTARIERLLSSRQRLITDASHQMRTPLAEMRTQIDYSLRQNDPELSHRTLIDVQTDLERLGRLLSQLLVQARSDPDGLPDQRMGPVDLAELARQTALDFVGKARKRSIDLSFDAPDEPVLVRGNDVLLRELIANLVDNAVHHGRESGAVAVRVNRLAGEVLLEVEDDGPGIAEPEREKVFERFYRSPVASAPGSGLGLSIVQDICRAHVGRVSLQAASGGQGLSVRVSIPELQERTLD